MQNVLIPTDFTTASFRLAEQAIKNCDKKINIVLFHAFALPDSAFDMLSKDYKRAETAFITESFRVACKQLKDNYPQIVNRITVKCLQGNTNSLFRNFIEANDIDLICCPVAYNYMSIHERSINPLPMFKKAGIPQVKELLSSKEYVFKTKNIFTSELATAG